MRCGLPAPVRRQECSAGGRRRRLCGDVGPCDWSPGERSGVTASHKAFHSASVIRLSFIRSWRIAIDTNCAVSWLALAIRTARQCSRVASAACNCWSECDTGPAAEEARSGRGDPCGRFTMPPFQRRKRSRCRTRECEVRHLWLQHNQSSRVHGPNLRDTNRYHVAGERIGSRFA